MRPGRHLLHRTLEHAGIKLSSQAMTREAFFEELEEGSIKNDHVPYGFQSIMTAITVYSEEFTSFIGYDNREFLANLCDLYDNPDKWVYRTKTQGCNTFLGTCINIVGATTPELIRTTLPKEAIGGGLTSRMILVYGEDAEKIESRPKRTPHEKQLFDELSNELVEIADRCQGEYTATDGWYELYDAFYKDNRQRQVVPDEKFAHYCGRRQVHLMKLCMVVAASRSNTMVLDEWVFKRAHEILRETEEKMPHVFSGFGRMGYAQVMPRIVAYIQSRKEVLLSDLYSYFSTDIDPKELNNILNAIAATGAIKIMDEGGRKRILFTPENRKVVYQ